MEPIFAIVKSKDKMSDKDTTEANVLMGTMVEQSTGEDSPAAQVEMNRFNKSVYLNLDGSFGVRNIQSVSPDPSASRSKNKGCCISVQASIC